MRLTDEQKQLIIKEFSEFKEHMYAGKSIEERKKLDQFFTPPSICIQMIESTDFETLAGETILDPTCGSGNLLAACLIAGADSDKVFGNELDKTMLDTCRKRLNGICRQLGKPDIPYHHLHRGDATDPRCLTVFSSVYKWKSKEEQTEVDKIEDALDASLDLFMKNFG
jgi:SAM-dependent methyltransferase